MPECTAAVARPPAHPDRQSLPHPGCLYTPSHANLKPSHAHSSHADSGADVVKDLQAGKAINVRNLALPAMHVPRTVAGYLHTVLGRANSLTGPKNSGELRALTCWGLQFPGSYLASPAAI